MPPAVREEAGGAALEETRARMVERLLRLVPEIGHHATAIEGLTLTRGDEAGLTTETCLFAPSIGVVLQGRKTSQIGGVSLEYGALDCLVNGVDMPSASRTLAASPEEPLLAVFLVVDRRLAIDVAATIPPATEDKAEDAFGVSVAPVSFDVLEAFSRLIELLEDPQRGAVFAPLLVREIITRVLLGPQGAVLKQVHSTVSSSRRVADAVAWLRENYARPLRVEALADRVGLAVSTFHRLFKKLTTLSPLQFQKSLRLYEARRLMLAEGMDAGIAARAVGYESQQQFNREYKRLFGEPPLRDVRRIRGSLLG